VHQHHLGALGGGALEQLAPGRDPGDESSDLLGTGYLEAVRTVVLEAGRLEQLVEKGEDVGDRRQG